MKTRDQIILDMCYTMRHDFGLAGSDHPFCITLDEARLIKVQMSQIYDNIFYPIFLENNPCNDGEKSIKEDVEELKKKLSELTLKFESLK